MQRKSRHNFSNSKTFELFFAQTREKFLLFHNGKGYLKEHQGEAATHIYKKDGGKCRHPEYIIPYILLEVRIDAAPL